MNQKNDEFSAVAMAMAMVGMAAMLMAAVIFAVLAFVSLAMTVVCFFAWKRPIMLFGVPLYPEEARRFVSNGLMGASLLTCFLAFACLLFGLKVVPDVWLYSVIGGYAVGSIWPEVRNAQQEEAQAAMQVIPPPTPPAKSKPPMDMQRLAKPAAESAPFRFASWDDEEERRS